LLMRRSRREVARSASARRSRAQRSVGSSAAATDVNRASDSIAIRIMSRSDRESTISLRLPNKYTCRWLPTPHLLPGRTGVQHLQLGDLSYRQTVQRAPCHPTNCLMSSRSGTVRCIDQRRSRRLVRHRTQVGAANRRAIHRGARASHRGCDPVRGAIAAAGDRHRRANTAGRCTASSISVDRAASSATERRSTTGTAARSTATRERRYAIATRI
jgi:hypothetical protein